MTATTSPVRHAIARSTGATTWTRKDGDTWRSTCLKRQPGQHGPVDPHGDETTAPNRGKAWVTGSHPQDFCAKCKVIAAGKAEKITGPRLDLPTAKKAAPKKSATKATTKKAATAR